MINLWAYMMTMAIAGVGMMACLILLNMTGIWFLQYVGIGFAMFGVGLMLVMVIKLKPYLKSLGGMMGGTGTSEKSWHSYPKDVEKKKWWKF
jgi:hypothetical protein